MLAPDLGIDLTVNEIVQQGDEMNAQLPVVKLSCSFVSAMAQGTYVRVAAEARAGRDRRAPLAPREAKRLSQAVRRAWSFAPMAGTIEQDLALSNAQLTQLINGIADASGLTAAEDARDVLDDDAPPSRRYWRTERREVAESFPPITEPDPAKRRELEKKRKRDEKKQLQQRFAKGQWRETDIEAPPPMTARDDFAAAAEFARAVLRDLGIARKERPVADRD